MNILPRLNVSSKEYSATTTFAQNQNRGYMAVYTDANAVTVELGDTGDAFILPANSVWEPRVCPTSTIKVTVAAGAFIAVTNHQE